MIKVSLQFGFGVEIFLQVLQHLLGRGGWRKALNGLSILVDDKLGEVPFDGVDERSSLLLLQVLVQRMSFLAVHINLVEQIEIHFVIASKALNFFSIAWLLMTKLITWKGENAQTCWEKKKVSVRIGQ